MSAVPFSEIKPVPAWQKIAPIADLVAGADVVDIKTAEGEVSLREFLAGALAYQPAWVTFLYYVRMGFVRLLGMRQEGVPKGIRVAPEKFPFEVGQNMSFFKINLAQEDSHWVANASESHLTAYLGVVAEPLEGNTSRFYFLTLVYYNHWTGRVYFNVIRLFHHLVVNSMIRAGLKH